MRRAYLRFLINLFCVGGSLLTGLPGWAQSSMPPITQPARQAPDARQTQQDKATPKTPVVEGVGEPVDPSKYVIGAEDVLIVRVWREPDLSGPVGVRPDGKITLPLIGEIQAGGQTPMQLGKALKDSLSTYINNPDVMVSVQSVQSKKYYIDGEVNRPGEYRLVTATTVLEALSQAGGFREFANSKKIRILRGNTTLKFNYKDVAKAKNMEQNIQVESGDHIIVP